MASGYWGHEDLAGPALFAPFLGAGTLTAHRAGGIWEIEIFQSVQTLLVASDETNPSCFGKWDCLGSLKGLGVGLRTGGWF